MKKLLIILLLMAGAGCATSIESVSKDYAASSTALKDFARISNKDWLFGSGIIQAAIPASSLPSWVFDELKIIDEWMRENTEIDEWRLGYTVGMRIRLAGPIIQASIKQYAPALLGIKEVMMVLSFMGL
uniref:Lipoprotein n=1 Tax=viral metagenome TaxID=1070528 RepID=A0A6M3KYE9_9ZZZZ